MTAATLIDIPQQGDAPRNYARLTDGSTAVPAVVIVAPDGTIGGTSQVSAAGTRVEGTIATGGAAQVAFGATPTNGWEIVNVHATETLYVRENGTATVADNSTSTAIIAGQAYGTPAGYKPTGDVSVIATTTGHAFIARRW